MTDGDDTTSGRSREFALAWENVDCADAAISDLIECWDELCDADAFSSRIAADPNSGQGQLDVLVDWPKSLLDRANAAACKFALRLKNAFDEALLAAARCVSGVLRPPDPALHQMPLCADPEAFATYLASGAFVGLRPDQIRHVALFQPFEPSENEVGTAIEVIRRAMRHLSAMVDPDRGDNRPRVAVWAHSATPEIAVDAPCHVASLEVERDGVLERVRTVAKFSIAGGRPRGLRGNPNIAFDIIFNDEPWPSDADDNLTKRSRALLAVASEFIRGLERSLSLRSDSRERSVSFRIPIPRSEFWVPVDLTNSPLAAEISEAFSSPNIGLAAHWDHEGRLTMLVKVGDSIYGRPIPPALSLDPTMVRGYAAEEATLAAASIWGLPDFVLNSVNKRKGSGQRQVGDGTIVTGGKGLAIQIKARQAVSGDPARERAWLLKKASEGARQAAGSVRSLRIGTTTFVNGRGRMIPLDGSKVSWVGAVILDHDAPPDGVIPDLNGVGLPTVAILRRDWEFLFDHLRSVSAVVDYFHRVASDDPRPLGEEPIRYFELAAADEEAAKEGPEPWAHQLGGTSASAPLLPKAPVSSADATGHAVFRVILEDIAEAPFDRDEVDRLHLLSLIDRLPVINRAELGRLLLAHLRDVSQVPVGVTRWRHRRIIQDRRLHLTFGTCSQFSETHREAFRQWTMLRHQEVVEAGITPEGEMLWTVAVLLTPRFDGYRLWDTTVFAIHGALDLSAGERAAIRAMWDSGREEQPV